MASAKRKFLAAVVALLLAVITLAILTPLSTPRIFLNHRNAIQSIRSLNLAETKYAAHHPDTGFACALSDLAELVDRLLASGTKSAYYFEVQCRLDAHQKAKGYAITAVTTKPGITGEYAFCSDQSGEIWYSENGSTSDCLAMRKPAPQKFK